jgi:hypothetical protein
MDESFQIRARRDSRKRPAALDFSMLTAALEAERAARAAATPASPVSDGAQPAEGEPLTELLLAGPDWQKAASAQHGCFNRAESKRRRNGP